MPAACQDLRDFPDTTLTSCSGQSVSTRRPPGTTAATPRTSGPPPRRTAWPRSRRTGAARPRPTAVSTTRAKSRTRRSGASAAGECDAACRGNSCGGQDCCEESRAIALQACDRLPQEPNGLVDVEPTSKTSYQCVETELNEGLGRPASAAAAPRTFRSTTWPRRRT